MELTEGAVLDAVRAHPFAGSVVASLEASLREPSRSINLCNATRELRRCGLPDSIVAALLRSLLAPFRAGGTRVSAQTLPLAVATLIQR